MSPALTLRIPRNRPITAHLDLRLFKITHDDTIGALRRQTEIHIVAPAPGTTIGTLDIEIIADVGNAVSAGGDWSADFGNVLGVVGEDFWGGLSQDAEIGEEGGGVGGFAFVGDDEPVESGAQREGWEKEVTK
ncbi:hypothetical protein BTUL_0049g00240 [Botrytis tulipae]|uniref:Uncharacterized protein n=1 Tax=Botrytis tulipae TaxID=87230 RepID=A0A4Z1ER80_9HELO|nr:hypothetical protein BTUL_0049g00240 [Botrytis tulipae]